MQLVHSTGSITPDLILGFDTNRVVDTRIHFIIGTENPDVTVSPARLQSGQLELFFKTEAQAISAMSLLAIPGQWSVTDPEIPSMSFKFVVVTNIRRSLDRPTRTRWVVTFDYQEVS